MVGIVTVPDKCPKKLPDLVFTIETKEGQNKEFKIIGERYAKTHDELCMIFVMPNIEDKGYIRLGMPFLSSFPMKLTAGDEPKISFIIPPHTVIPDDDNGGSGTAGAIVAIILVLLAICGAVGGFIYYRKRQQERQHPYSRTVNV